MLENNTKDKKFKKLIVFVALSYLVIYAKSYADQVQDIPKPNATEQQTNKVILPAKENKSVDNSEEEKKSEEGDKSEDKKYKEDTENTDAILQNKTVEQNNIVEKPIIMKKPVEKIIVCGIELGRTTIKELEAKHKPTYIFYRTKRNNKIPVNWKAYSFDPNDFGTKELPLGGLYVSGNEAGIIYRIRIEIPERMFDDVKQKYINKQFELIKEEQKDGINTIVYKSTDKTVILEKSEKNFVVEYCDDEFKKSIDSTSSMQNTATNSKESKKTEDSDKSKSDGIDDLKPLGIVIGSTTEKELKSKYKIEHEWYGFLKKFGSKEFFKMLCLDTTDFNNQKSLKWIAIGVDKKGIVQYVHLQYFKDLFKDISDKLSKKYSKVRYSNDYAEYEKYGLFEKTKKRIYCSVNQDGTSLMYLSEELTNTLKVDKQKNPAPYGIELGKTTENEIRFRHKVVNEFTTNQQGKPSDEWQDPCFHFFRQAGTLEISFPSNLKILILDAKNFSIEKLPVEQVSVAFDENKKVCAVSVVYPILVVNYLKELLRQKYKIIDNRTLTFSDCYISFKEPNTIYKAPNATIGLLFGPKKTKNEDEDLFLSLISNLSVAVNYCLDSLLHQYIKKWLQGDQKIQNLL